MSRAPDKLVNYLEKRGISLINTKSVFSSYDEFRIGPDIVIDYQGLHIHRGGRLLGLFTKGPEAMAILICGAWYL